MIVCTRLLPVFFVVLWATCLRAQQPSSSPAYGVERTDENSPLFLERLDLLRTRATDEENNLSWSKVSKLPPAVQPYPSFAGEIRAGTKAVMSAFKRAAQESKPSLSVVLEPAEFELKERREITVTLTLKNESNHQIRMNFPTSQRIELITKDKMGKVIERWSDDRTFEPLEGIVVVNKNESIEYSERIPTREMKSGETYTIEASLFNNPQYAAKIVSVCPK